MDDKKRAFYDSLPTKKLNSEISSLKKSVESIGKMLPKLDGVEREMRMGEQTRMLEEIDELKLMVNRRKEEELAKKAAEKEKLKNADALHKALPTVMGILDKKKAAAEEKTEETEKSETVESSDEVEGFKSVDEESGIVYSKSSLDDPDDIDIEIISAMEPIHIPATPASEESVKPIEEILHQTYATTQNKELRASHVLNLDAIMATDGNMEDAKLVDNFEQSTPDDYGIPDNDMTDVLQGIADEIVSEPVQQFTAEDVRNMSAEDRERERCRQYNYQNTLIHQLRVQTVDSIKERIRQNIRIVAENLHLLSMMEPA